MCAPRHAPLGFLRAGEARPGSEEATPLPFAPADLPSCGQVCESRRGRTPGASSSARA